MSFDLHINPSDIISQAQDRVSGSRLQAAHNASQKADAKDHDKALMGLAYEFEKILLEQMMSSMRKTVQRDGLFGQSLGGSIYREVFETEVINQSVGKSSFGLAENIYRQLSALSNNAAADENSRHDSNKSSNTQGGNEDPMDIQG